MNQYIVNLHRKKDETWKIVPNDNACNKPIACSYPDATETEPMILLIYIRSAVQVYNTKYVLYAEDAFNIDGVNYMHTLIRIYETSV